MEITGKQSKCRRSLKNLKSESRNLWLNFGCKIRDGDFWKGFWVSILVLILSILLEKYRYYIDTYFLRYFPSLVQKLEYSQVFLWNFGMRKNFAIVFGKLNEKFDRNIKVRKTWIALGKNWKNISMEIHKFFFLLFKISTF